MLRLVGLGVALRLAVPALAWWTAGSLDVYYDGFWRDSRTYLQLAASLLDNGEYQAAGHPELFRPPGFPLLLVPAVASGHPLAVIAILNAALGGITVALTYAAARALAGDRAGWWAGLLCAVEPGQILHSGFVMAEPLFTALVVAVALSGIVYLRSGRRRAVAGLGVAVAAAAYVKTIAYFLPLWVASALWLLATQPARRRAAHISLFLAAAIGLIGLWHARNLVTAGYAGFSTQIARAALYREASGLRALREGVSVEEVRQLEAAEAGTDLRSYETDHRVTGRMWARFADAVRQDVPGFVALHLYGGLKVLAKPWEAELVMEQAGRRLPEDGGVMPALVGRGARGAFNVLLRRGPLWLTITMLSTAVFGTYLVLAVFGTVSGGPVRARLWLMALIAYFVILASGTAAFYEPTRFRVPIMPIMSILAALWIARPSRARERAVG